MEKVPCEIFSRVVGYYRPVAQFNKGAKAQFFDRKTFHLPTEEILNERRRITPILETSAEEI